MIEEILQSIQKIRKGSIVNWFQHILNYSKLVKDLSQTIGLDESPIYYIYEIKYRNDTCWLIISNHSYIFFFTQKFQ